MGNFCCHETPTQSEILRPISVSYKNDDNRYEKVQYENKFKQQQLTSNNNDYEQPINLQPKQGVISLPDGSHYSGYIKNGIPHGNGVETHENGDRYTGTFFEGLKDGRGVYHYVNGIIYDGEFKRGDMTGIGKMVWPNGDWYEGYFLNNLMHGPGKYYSKLTNSYFQGTYLQGKRHGKGRIISNNNSLQGNWQNGQFVFKKQVKFPS